MVQLHYKPSDGWLADVIPFYWNGEFHLFYLHDYRDIKNHGEGVAWRRISTSDFVHFQEAGEMLARGSVNEQDLYVFTGSVMHAQSKFHIFYTGHNPHFRAKGYPEEGVMHAVSEDLLHWEKRPEETFYAPLDKAYEPNDWRDPFVFFDSKDGLYHMLLAARQSCGAKVRRGLTAHLTSADLRTWKLCDPLWAPMLYYTHECPDLFQIGSWYYLIFSEFSDMSRTRYVMARSLSGPWLAPKDDAFDTRAFYAAKSASDGEKRYLFGWVPTRVDDSDAKPHMWGGSMVVHEIVQREDGTLGCLEPESLKNHWQIVGQSDQPIALSCPDGYRESVYLPSAPDQVRISCTLKLDRATHEAGIRVGYDPDEDLGFAFAFDVQAQVIRFKRMPNHPWGAAHVEGLERPLPAAEDGRYDLTLIMDGAIMTLYVNASIAMTVRMCNPNGRAIAFYAAHGEVVFQDIVHSAWISAQ